MKLSEDDVRAVILSFVGRALDLPEEEAARAVASTPIGEHGLGADSLDLVELATRVNRFFRLHETGLEDDLLRRPTVGGWTEAVLRSWDLGERRLSFRTSGSTGEPEERTHDWGSLTEEIDALARIFEDRERVVGLVPRHHIYGFLFTVLLPRRLDVAFLNAADLSPGALFRSVRDGDLIVSFPLRWDYLRQTGLRFPPGGAGVDGVTSTGPCPPGLIAALRARSLRRMVEMYGSSETAGIGWRDDPDDPYRLLPYWSVEREGGTLSRRAPGGDQMTFPVPDRLTWDRDGFFVAGRRDRAVQIAGTNVYPDRVARVLRTHPKVADCAVRLMRPEEGWRLKAFVVPDTVPDAAIGDRAELRRELRRWLRDKVEAPERPGSITLGAVLPLDAQGKAADWPCHFEPGEAP